MLRPNTIQRVDMVTEAFSGATTKIQCKGDHISGLLPDCHVVPSTKFNLLATGPYLDRLPGCAIILTATRAIQLDNVNFNDIMQAANPRVHLVKQLQRTNAKGDHLVSLSTIGARKGPGSLYTTNLFDVATPSDARNIIINSAMTGAPIPNFKIPNSLLAKYTSTASHTPPPLSHSNNASGKAKISQASKNHATQWTSSTTVEKALIELRFLHCALGHPSEEVLLQALNDSPNTHHQQLRKYVKLMDNCNVCPLGKQRELPHPHAATTRAPNFLDRLILDCSGKQPVASLGGHWYFLLIVDDATRTKWVRLLKSIPQVASILDTFLRTVVRQGTKGARGCVQHIRTDNGPEFNCTQFKMVLRRHSITYEPSPPDGSHQRGIAERGIGVLMAITRSSLVWAKAPLPFWGECVTNHATPTSNNTPHSANPDNKSPYQLANPGRDSQLHKLRPFGCLAFTLIKAINRNGKLNPTASCGFFAGYGLTPDGTINGYRVMNFKTQRFTTKINVKFNVQLPALRYALSAMVHSPQQMLVGRTVTKRFPQGVFHGTVTSFSTEDNVTLYDIKYSDGDNEQMDILDVLRHIDPVQSNMLLKQPSMHKRLRQSTPSDRARIGKDLLVPPSPRKPPTTTTSTATSTSAPLPPPTLRRSLRRHKYPNRLTSASPGSLSGSASLPLATTFHTSNKANVAKLPTKIPTTTRRRPTTTHKFTTMPMMTILVNAVLTTSPPPNDIVDGIHLHRYNSNTPPLPKIPPRDVPPPLSYEDAVNGPYGSFWRPAVQKEIDSLFRHGVWRLEPLPPGALVLPCKFVFRVKPDGKDPPGIDKFKSRYCGKGFHQKKGVHYLNSHAPVASAVANRIVVAVSTELNWPLEGMDVSNAYLNAPLESSIVIFVEPPPTIHVPKGYGLRLLKGLYGTMQGGNRWAHHKHIKLTKLGYTRNPSEPSLYHRLDRHGIVLTSIVVDDFQITGWPPEAVTHAKQQLKSTWDMTDLGPLRFFTSVEINRDMKSRTTTLKQTSCIENILAKYNMADSYGKQTPCTASIYSQRLLDPVSPYAPMFGNNYRNIVGSLGYLRHTRPDICVALGIASQFAKMGRHGPQHYRGLRNIIRYCKRTVHHGLLYTSTFKSIQDPWIVSAHVDSDWAAWKATRRSRTGYLIYLCNCLIAFGSKLQPAVALSSAEAEYMALSYVTRLLLWIIHMIEAIPGQFVKRPVLVYEDNKPCINLANNRAASRYTRHIGICHHFLRDHYDDGDKQFKLIWTQSSTQRADGMTKPLPRADFLSFRDSVVSDLTC